MTKITLKDVLATIQVHERIAFKPIKHTNYNLILHFLPHRCYESITHLRPKEIIKFIKHQFPENLTKMFTKNLSQNFGGEIISERARKSIQLNREKDNNDNDKLLVSISYNLFLFVLSYIIEFFIFWRYKIQVFTNNLDEYYVK